MRTQRGAPSPLPEGAVSAVAAAAAISAASATTGSILLSTVILVAHRIMTAQSRLLLARGLVEVSLQKPLILINRTQAEPRGERFHSCWQGRVTHTARHYLSVLERGYTRVHEYRLTDTT